MTKSRRSPRHSREARALLPKLPRRRIVLGGRRGCGEGAFVEIFARDAFDLGRGRHVDGSQRAPLGRDREQAFGERQADAEESAVRVAEAGGDEARMEAISGNARAGK